MDSYMDQYRTGPETVGGRYMRLFWHPVYRSEDLKPGWANPIKIMSENFTLYRGESGAAHGRGEAEGQWRVGGRLQQGVQPALRVLRVHDMPPTSAPELAQVGRFRGREVRRAQVVVSASRRPPGARRISPRRN